MKSKLSWIKIYDSIIILLLFYFCSLPILAVVLYGVTSEGREIGPNQIARILSMLKNSLSIATIVTITAVILGVIATLTLYRVSFRGRNVMRMMMLLPLVNPAFVGSISFIMLFGRRGLITYKLLNLNVSPYGWHGVFILQVLVFTTLAYLIISSGVRNTDTSLEEAARNLGASESKVFFRVTLPMMMPEISVAALMIFLASMADFTTPLIIGGSFRTLASDLYIQITGVYDMKMATATGIVLLVPCIIAFFLHRYISEKKRYHSDLSSHAEITYQNVPRWLKYSAISLSSLTIAIFVLNFCFIVVGAFTKNWGFDYTLTLNHLRTALDQDFNRLLKPLLNSVILSVITGFVSSLTGVLLAYRIQRRTIMLPKFVDFMCLFTAAVPGILFGIGYLVTFKYSLFGIGQFVLKGTQPIILLGTGIIIYLICIARSINFSMKAGYALLEHTDEDLENAALNLGASKTKAFFWVVLPVLKDAFVNSYIKVFSNTMTTLGAIIFLLMPSNKVIIQVIFQAITGANIGATAIMALMLSMITLILILLFYLLAYGKSSIDVIRRKRDENRITELN